MYLKTWYDPMLDAPREPRHVDDRLPPAPASPLTGLRRRIATTLFELGRIVSPDVSRRTQKRRAYY